MEDFKFYKIIRTVNKGHKHYSYSVITLTNLNKAIRMQKKWPDTSILVELTTKKNGKVQIRKLKIAKEPTEKPPLF